MQSADASFPKQRRALAAKEFKHAMVAHKRLWKVKQEGEGISQLSQDVLVHIFSFLDLRSLVSATFGCRSWNRATSENNLWRLQYSIFFADSDNHSDVNILLSGQVEKTYTRVTDDLLLELVLIGRKHLEEHLKEISPKNLSRLLGVAAGTAMQ